LIRWLVGAEPINSPPNEDVFKSVCRILKPNKTTPQVNVIKIKRFTLIFN